MACSWARGCGRASACPWNPNSRCAQASCDGAAWRGPSNKSRLVWAKLRISFGAHRQCLALIRVGNPFRAQLRRNISELGKRAKPLPVDEREAAIHSCCTQPRTSTALNSMANKARAACARVARILKKFWRGDQDRWEPWPASYAVALPVQGEGEAAASLQVCVRR